MVSSETACRGSAQRRFLNFETKRTVGVILWPLTTRSFLQERKRCLEHHTMEKIKPPWLKRVCLNRPPSWSCERCVLRGRSCRPRCHQQGCSRTVRRTSCACLHCLQSSPPVGLRDDIPQDNAVSKTTHVQICAPLSIACDVMTTRYLSRTMHSDFHLHKAVANSYVSPETRVPHNFAEQKRVRHIAADCRGHDARSLLTVTAC